MPANRSSAPNQAALGRALGLTRARVGQLVQQGMPTSSVEAARAWREANVAAYMRPDAPADRTPHGRSPEGAPPGRGTADADDVDESPSYARSRARRAAAEADLAQLEVDRAAGRLVERADVERLVFDSFRNLRNRVMACPRRVAPAVAATADVGEIEAAVAKELGEACAGFEGAFSDQLAACTAPGAA